MFKRLLFDTWEGFVPVAGFCLTAGAFLLIIIRALRMRRPEADRLARLPLEPGAPVSSPASPSSGHVPL